MTGRDFGPNRYERERGRVGRNTGIDFGPQGDDLARKIFSAPLEERQNIIDEEIHNILGAPLDLRGQPGDIGLVKALPTGNEPTPLPAARPPEAPPRPPWLDYQQQPQAHQEEERPHWLDDQELDERERPLPAEPPPKAQQTTPWELYRQQKPPKPSFKPNPADKLIFPSLLHGG